MITGYRSPSQLVRIGRAHAAPGLDLPALDRAFAIDHRPHCFQHFSRGPSLAVAQTRAMDWAALLALIRLNPILVNGLGVFLAILLRQNVIESSVPIEPIYALFAAGYLGVSGALVTALAGLAGGTGESAASGDAHGGRRNQYEAR